MTAWAVVVGAGIVTVALRGAAAFSGARTQRWVERLQPGLAPSLLAALIVTQTWSSDLDTAATRLAGVATAVVLLALRVPSLAALATAAAVAATLRALG